MARKSVNDQPATLESVAAFDFEAAFDDETRKKIERHAQDKDMGITRRIALTVLCRSKAQLVEGFSHDDESRELLSKTIEKVDGYINHLKGVVETMETAQARLLCVAGTIAASDDAATTAGA